MSTSKHIYDYGDGTERVVILNHGASETTVLYDSHEKQYSKPKLTNLEKWLKAAKDADDL